MDQIPFRPFCNSICNLLFLAALLTVLPYQAGAEPLDEKNTNGQSLTVKTAGSVVAPRNVGKQGATVTTASAGVEAVYKRGNATLTVAYELIEYDWDKVEHLPFGNGKDDPWTTLHRFGADFNYRGVLYNSWGYFVGGYTGLSYENELDDAFNFLGYGGLSYSLSDEWSLSLGAGVKYHTVETFAFPVVGITYISKSIKGLAVELNYPLASASYRFNDWLGLRVFGRYVYGMFKLRKESTAEPGGYIETRGYRTGMSLDLWPLEMVQLSLGCTYDFAGDYSLYRSNGARIKRYDRDDGLGGSLQLKVNF